jgi:isoleucyl-tRNA synthetase
MSAQVVVHAPAPLYVILSAYPTPPAPDNLLARVFGVSQAEVAPTDGDLQVEVSPAQGQKCARCWLVLPDVDAETELCARCKAVIGA